MIGRNDKMPIYVVSYSMIYEGDATVCVTTNIEQALNAFDEMLSDHDYADNFYIEEWIDGCYIKVIKQA